MCSVKVCWSEKGGPLRSKWPQNKLNLQKSTSDTLLTLVLHVSDDVSPDPVLRHHAGVALVDLHVLRPPEHSPERGGNAAPGLAAAGCGRRPRGEPQGAEEESLLALHVLRVWEATHAEETRGQEQRTDHLRPRLFACAHIYIFSGGVGDVVLERCCPESTGRLI